MRSFGPCHSDECPQKRPRRSARKDPDAIAAREAAKCAARVERERSHVAAAARREAVRVMKRGRLIEFDHSSGRVSSEGPRGVARWRVTEQELAEVLRLHETIKTGCQSRMGWAGGSDVSDSRWRCFGLLPGSREALVESGIALHSFETPRRDQAREESRNWASVVDVEECYLNLLSEAAAGAVAPEYAADVSLGNLIALQPNVHGGSEFLPRHLDWPRNDGFGVVIVTIAVKRDATVVLTDHHGHDFYFELPEGYAYALSADARNTCTHGLFCFGAGDRESLNLRFGLHDHMRAKADIYRHWTELNPAVCGPDGPIYDD